MVLSGSATAAFENGDVHTMNKGDLFYISPEPHDSWVVGGDDYISLHLLERKSTPTKTYLIMICQFIALSSRHFFIYIYTLNQLLASRFAIFWHKYVFNVRSLSLLSIFNSIRKTIKH